MLDTLSAVQQGRIQSETHLLLVVRKVIYPLDRQENVFSLDSLLSALIISSALRWFVVYSGFNLCRNWNMKLDSFL